MNTNFSSLLVQLDQGIEPMSTDCKANALTTSACGRIQCHNYELCLCTNKHFAFLITIVLLSKEIQQKPKLYKNIVNNLKII